MNNFFNNLFDEYGLRARLYPALICSLPFLLIKIVLLDKYVPNITERCLTIAFAGIPLWAILVYFLTQINRFVSKSLFEDKNDFPTLKMLTPSSTGMSPNMRDKITKQVRVDFNIDLPNLHDENTDFETTKTRIKEIVGLIITKVGAGKLLLQHNIEYGFARNLIGGSVIAATITSIDVFIFRWILLNNTAFILSIALLICYLVPIAFSKIILRNYGQEYAEKLFREYVSIA